MNMVAEETEAADRVGGDELLQEQPPEQAGEHADGQEKSRPTGHPALAIGRDATARHDHVHVGVMGHSRAPVCSTEVIPILAPRCLGSAAIVSIVSAETLNKRS